MCFGKGVGEAEMVSSVFKQEQPVSTGWRSAVGCFCQEKGQWGQHGDAARAPSLHRLLRSTFQELSIQAGRCCLRRAHEASGGSNADTVLWLGPCLQTSSGLRRPKQEQRSPRGEISQQIPKVWKDSSLQGSGPKSVIILITQAVII